MILVPLTKGKFALIDEIDSDLLNRKWHASNDRKFYARAGNGDIRMHRVILTRIIGREMIRGEEVDHINGDSLDNRRSNLRLTDHRGNSRNRAKRRFHKGMPTASKYKGVFWNRETKRWVVQVNEKGFGAFDDEIEAAKAYDKAAKSEFGEFAKTNF